MQGNNQNNSQQNNNQSQIPSFESGFEFSVPSENNQNFGENLNQGQNQDNFNSENTKRELARRLDALKGISPKEAVSSGDLPSEFQSQPENQPSSQPESYIKPQADLESSFEKIEPQTEKPTNEVKPEFSPQSEIKPAIEPSKFIEDSVSNFSTPETSFDKTKPSNLNLENIPEFKPKEPQKESVEPKLNQIQNQNELPKVESLKPSPNDIEIKTFSEKPEEKKSEKEEDDTQAVSPNPGKPKASGTRTKPKDGKKKNTKKNDNNPVKASGVLKKKGKVVLNADVYEKILWSILHHYSGKED